MCEEDVGESSQPRNICCYYLLHSSLKKTKACWLQHIENVGLSNFWYVLFQCPRGEAGPLGFPMVCELRNEAATAWESILVVNPHPSTLQGKLMSFTRYGTMSNWAMLMLTFYPMFQGWFSQKKLLELSRTKVAQSLICWSQAKPKSSSLILLEQSWAQKLKFNIDRAEP